VNRTGSDDPNIYLISLIHRRTLNSVQKTLKPYAILCEGDDIDLRVKHGKNRNKSLKRSQVKEDFGLHQDNKSFSEIKTASSSPKLKSETEQSLQGPLSPKKEFLKEEEF